jgi:hypothetical protein
VGGPPAHGIYRELDLQLLDPGDEDERALLMEVLHPQFADALRGEEDVIIDGKPVNPRLHVVMHQVVANQLLAADPPEKWQTVQRLAGRGYDWHNIMPMIASLVTEDVYGVLNESRKPDPAVGRAARRPAATPASPLDLAGSTATDRDPLATPPLCGIMPVIEAQSAGPVSKITGAHQSERPPTAAEDTRHRD